MTKRYGNFEFKSNKKSKPEDNLEDVWGDDPDIDDIDDCFALAAQICEKKDAVCTQRNNVSILPTYSAFKPQPNSGFTSTQSCENMNENRNSSFATTSTANNTFKHVDHKPLLTKPLFPNQQGGLKRTQSFNVGEKLPQDFQIQITTLEDRCEAKQGEVTNLRNQIKKFKVDSEAELNRRQQEASRILSATTKELNAVKAELSFKDLEILHLKQKVVQVAKLSNLDVTLNSTRGSISKPIEEHPHVLSICNQKKPVKVQPTVDSALDKYISNTAARQVRRNVQFEHKNRSEKRDVIVQAELMGKHKPVTIANVFYEFDKLILTTPEGLDCTENNRYINKIICLSQQLLLNFLQQLKELEKFADTESIRQMDVAYLEQKMESRACEESIFDGNVWCKNEIGINARQSIALLSEILPNSSYLKGYLLENKRLTFKSSEEYNCFSAMRNTLKPDYTNNFQFLQLIVSILEKIGYLRMSPRAPGFLYAVISLSSKICSCSSFTNVQEFILEITKQVIFARPDLQNLCCISKFLKNASLHRTFVEALCRPPDNNFKMPQRGGVIYYNKDSCILRVLCVLIEESVLQRENCKLILKLKGNTMKFILNCLKSTVRWMYYQETKCCDCLRKLNKLFVAIMYNTVQAVQENLKQNGDTSRYENLIKLGIRVLHIINFKFYDLIVKCIITYSQYKHVLNTLIQLKTALKLSAYEVNVLNMTEDAPVALEDKAFDEHPLLK